jgi:predicted aldo/keto reductase-like oxidoreductase
MSEASTTDNGKRSSLSGWIVAAAWLLTVVAGYYGIGEFLSRLVEGILPDRISKPLIAIPVLALIGSIALTVLWARRLRARGAGAPEGGELRSGRRRFLAGAAASLGGLLGVGAASFARLSPWITVTKPRFDAETPTEDPSPRAEWSGARIREYRRLGRTDARISDISLGSTKIRAEKGGEELARRLIELGVNYFDTAPDYAEAGSELLLGRAMKGYRDQMFIATKFCTPQGHLPPHASVREHMEVVEASLKRLQTDHVDLVHIHACNSVGRLLAPNTHEAFDRLKEQGKVRFLGFSSHTPRLEQVADAAIESGRIDVMMLAYHHGSWPLLGELIDRAAQKDIGVVAMKTLKGARHRGLLDSRDEADSYTQAAFKWVLGNPHVAGLVISFFQPEHANEYLYASGRRPTSEDLALLEKYDRQNAARHCHQHCGACLDSCPEGLAIDDVLRYRMYFEDYGDEKDAMRLYAKLERQADACIGCSAPCAGACPHGLPIQERTSGAHGLLTLA